MNRIEWYSERRKWRLVVKSLNADPRIKDLKDREIVRNLIWDLVYSSVPQWFWYTYFVEYHSVFSYDKSKQFIKLNLEYAPNSYPHKTRNP